MDENSLGTVQIVMLTTKAKVITGFDIYGSENQSRKLLRAGLFKILAWLAHVVQLSDRC